ncbi:MAG: HAD-IC family P-type ATPase, partial [Pseudomonadota bacterium]
MTALAGQRDLGNGLSDLICAVGGLKCGSCSAKIERALNAVEGVTLARVNLTTGRARLIWETARANPEDLLDRIAALGFEAHAIQLEAAPATREPSVLIALAVAAFGTMNVMGFSTAVWAGLVSDMGHATREMMHWLSALIALPVAAFSGRVFYHPALRGLRHGRFNMDAAISFAILTTLAGSLYETIRGGEEVYFDAAVSLILFLLVGRWLDGMIRERSRTASDNLRQLVDRTARRIGPDGIAQSVSVEDLAVGDEVLVSAGARLPVDGVLANAEAEIDESLITGESLPRHALSGQPVIAGSLAIVAALRVKVTATGRDTRLSAIADLTEQAEQHRGPAQQQAERFAAAYGPSVIAAALAGFLLWWVVLDASLSQSLMIAVAVLIVTCPCAAGLSTPAVMARAVNLAMGKGVILKDGAALERLADVDRLVIDKTGTLTDGIELLPGALSDADLSVAASMAAGSTHPLACAIAAACPQTALPGVIEIPGQGLEAPDGTRLGSAAFTRADDGEA